ncbi:MAG: radical SAM protein [Candidatus Omnitrophota bacterium]
MPRLPFEGIIDLTYRCNNNCRHCWLRISPDSKDKRHELSLEDIKKIVDDAKTMGCHKWSISGGEPILRPDFLEIFDYITSNSRSYSINTNGSLITKKIAGLFKRIGAKMIALYGATAKVHDHITRNPGSFEATMQGIRYLKEARAGFMIQLVPMRDNYHEFEKMKLLARSLSKHYRIGAAWLFLSASGDEKVNKEIIYQRLSPKEAARLDTIDLSTEDNRNTGLCPKPETHLFSSCIKNRREFHIDPYGGMSFCSFVKEPGLRYSLKKSSFKKVWEELIPSLADKIKVTKDYLRNCGKCDLKSNCLICPVYSYLEHRKFSKKIDYLCDMAKENRKLKEDWKKNNRRYFNIADVTIRVDSDMPINNKTFSAKFKQFEVNKPGKDIVKIRHHFKLPDLKEKDLGELYYKRLPWAIYKKGLSWIYMGILPDNIEKKIHKIVVFNNEHTSISVYSNIGKHFSKGGLQTLSLLPTDQIFLARLLADREGCVLHASGVELEGKGLLFVGVSGAGKSTMIKMLKGSSKILCDDRIIVRKQPEGFKMYGTWSHGEIPEVSNASALLKGVFFLNKSKENKIELINDKREITRKLLPRLIKPFVTVEWWEKSLQFIEKMADEGTFYNLYFDKSGNILNILQDI